MSVIDNLTVQLRADEGEEECVYQDSLGYWTIGVGRLVDPRKKGAGLRQAEIDFMLANDIADRVQALTAKLPWFAGLDEARQGVLLNMSFQLGVDGLMAFVTTLQYIEVKRFDAAADNMLKSRWASQTPERAKRLSQQMRTGKWVIQGA